MGRPEKKLKVSAQQGIATPPTTTTTKTSTISKRTHNSVHRSDEDHTTAEPPKKGRCIASSRSTASQRASIDNLDCDNVPDVPETDLLALEQVWRQVKKIPSPPLPSTSLAQIGKSLGTYTARIFTHRSIRFKQIPNCQQLYSSDMEQSQLQYNGDLVLADEEENNTTLLDLIIDSLGHRLLNERTWEGELYFPHIFPQTGHLQIPSVNDPPLALRLIQHIMKTVIPIPGVRLPYISYPPIISKADKRLTDGLETIPLWLTPIKEGKVINDIIYAVNDPGFWTGIRGRDTRKQVRAQLAGYKLFPDSDYMLPYLLIEDKRQGNNPDCAKAYVILIAACILHQRLKLRALGNMHTTVSCPELIVHCMVMVGSRAHYIRVGLRAPSETHDASADELRFVRYHAEIRGIFNLTRYTSRNQFKSLLRMIHAFGIGSHHETQKLEVKNAVEVLISVEDGFGNSADMESIMSVDTAFHCVPVEGQEGEYVLRHTDMTMNSQRGDGLEPDLPRSMDEPDSSNADTRNLLLSMDDSESSETDTKEKPAKPAAKNKAPAKKRKAPAKEKKEPVKGSPTSRKRKIEARVDEEEQGETEEVTQEKEPASKRARRHVSYKE